MPMRRMILVGIVAAVVVSAVTVAAIATGGPEPACGCSVEPDLRGPAERAAERFEALVRRADVPGAWALLTDAARSRYVDVAGFQPVFDRLGKALHEAGTGIETSTGAEASPGVAAGTGVGAGGHRPAGGWLAVDLRVRYDTPSEVVAVRYSPGPARPVWPLLILAPLGHPGDERIDPEPPALRLTAVSDGDGVRVELPDGDLRLTSFVVIDGAGQRRLPGRERVTAAVDRLTWSPPLEGPIVAVAIERSGTGLRVGAATVR
jgi:hypothetical protein